MDIDISGKFVWQLEKEIGKHPITYPQALYVCEMVSEMVSQVLKTQPHDVWFQVYQIPENGIEKDIKQIREACLSEMERWVPFWTGCVIGNFAHFCCEVSKARGVPLSEALKRQIAVWDFFVDVLNKTDCREKTEKFLDTIRR
jgi:hypothetical protein